MNPSGAEKIATFPEGEKLLLISVNKTVGNPNLTLYDAVRYSWKVSKERADKADYILAVAHGEIVGAFEVEGEWMPAEKRYFPDIPDAHGNWRNQGRRFGFRGHEAPNDVQLRYCGKRLPLEFRHRQNPIRYVHC